MKRLKFADYLAVAINIALIAVFSFHIYSQDFHSRMVRIESEGKSWVYPINEDRTLHIEGQIGETHVEIEDGMVRISDSPCSDKVCVYRGWMSEPGEWAACLPNGVLVTIEGNAYETIDAFSN